MFSQDISDKEVCLLWLRELITVSNGFSNSERFQARAIYCLNRHVFYTLTSSLNSKKREGKTRGSYNKQKDSVLDDDPNNSIDTMTDDFDDWHLPSQFITVLSI